MNRKITKEIKIGDVGVGGDNPVRVQSMTNTDTRNSEKTLVQIRNLQAAGCEIIRVAVPDVQAAESLKLIVAGSPLPVIADIHFDYRLALRSIEAGVHGLRLNPGNIGDESRITKVVDAARSCRIPVRIGVNSGSVDRKILKKHGGPTPEAMVESAMEHIRILEDRNFDLIKVSLKSSSVCNSVRAYKMLAEKCSYPLHIGITEAGTPMRGAVKSGVGLGILLYEGIGDTLRVSLTGDPEDEMLVAWEILRSLGLRQRGPEIISCPTCGRTEIDMASLAAAVEKRLKGVEKIFTVAVMGCVVNGPGEAREADIGLAGGRDCGIIFKKGRVIKKTQGDNLLPEFMQELEAFLGLT
ncbi:MAG: flavodoxin-dependent (E)-4-hydroxy-3-methylbut-2-enyl-diphosphate synthase [Desulfonatronovibrio sp.]